MKRDPSVYLLGEDISTGGAFTATRGLLQEFGPERVRDTPISEAAMVGLGIGAASLGLRPVVEIMFFDFIAVAIDQLVNQAAKMRYMFGGQARVPLTVMTQFSAADNSGPQHSQSLEAWFAHVPGLKLVMPATPYDAKGLLKAAIRDDNPVLYVANRTLFRTLGEVPDEEYVVPLGVAEVRRPGKDITIVATSRMVMEALAAAETLVQRGIQAEVVDPRSISPLDMNTIIDSVKKTRRLIVVHEAVKIAGIGAEIAATVSEEAFDYLDAPIVRLGAAFAPMPFSPALNKVMLPDRTSIVAAVERMLG